jgi:hypothetical protein
MKRLNHNTDFRDEGFAHPKHAPHVDVHAPVKPVKNCKMYLKIQILMIFWSLAHFSMNYTFFLIVTQ